jgi:hypothetical protein
MKVVTEGPAAGDPRDPDPASGPNDPGWVFPPRTTWVDPPGGWVAPPPDPTTAHPLAGPGLDGHGSNGTAPRSHPRRRRRARAAVAVLAALVLAGAAIGVGVAAAGSGTSPSPSTGTARTLLHQAEVAAGAAGTFHYVAISEGGTSNQTTAGVAGRVSGTQDITADSSAFGTERFSLRLVNDVVYFKGNTAAVEDQLGVSSAAAAAAHAQRWIAVQRSDAPYAALAAGMTADSALGQIAIAARTTTAIGNGGARIWRIAGGIPDQQGQSVSGRAHLDLDGTTKLPLSYVSTESSGGQQNHSTFTFSHWGATVSVPIPPDTVPFSSVSSSTNSGGPGGGPSFST